MSVEHEETVTQIRDTVRKVCEEFSGEYWRAKDRERQYPTEFVDKLTELGLLAALIPEEYGGSGMPISIGSATAVFVVLLAMGRLIRRLTDAIAKVLGRLAPDVMARGLAAVMVTVIGAVVLGSLPRLAVVALHPVFRSANAATAPGVEPPTSDYVSGGPGSAIAWSDLGDQGRTFVSGVTSTSDLEDFSGRQAREPIRAFVGVDSAGTAQARAQLAVAELERLNN